ncbi:MAG: hypothetical protein K6L81_03075 [Agarilytica sp.]
MEKDSLKLVEQTLGIYPPWKIDNISFNDAENQANITLGMIQKTSRLSIFNKIGNNEVKPTFIGKWFHIKLGKYRCIVHAPVTANETRPTHAIDEYIASLPSFVGNDQRQYSNELRQEIAQNLLKGFDEQKLSSIYDLPKELVGTIVKDLDTLPAQMESLSYLPTETAVVWGNLLSDKHLLKTQSIPLKMLLSKLKLANARRENKGPQWEHINELRQFFILNANNLTSEVQQLCGLIKTKSASPQRSQRRAKLVLPSLKSPVWLDIMSAKLPLHSQSIALNLLISSQRSAFVNGRSSQEKLAAVSTIREYFLKNHRKLRPELLLINRALAIHKKSAFKLPNAEHMIWKKILHDEEFVSSNHMAYQLLLSKLRAQIKLNRDPVIELEAARSIRSFLSQNQHSMKKELYQMFKSSPARTAS